MYVLHISLFHKNAFFSYSFLLLVAEKTIVHFTTNDILKLHEIRQLTSVNTLPYSVYCYQIPYFFCV